MWKTFSTLAQHSEAASLCFSRITALKTQFTVPPSFSYDSPKWIAPSFFLYSCYEWPRHCRLAFDEDSSCSLVTEAKDFILSGSYLKWNDCIRFFDSLSGDVFDPTATWQFKALWCDHSSINPGFVIASFGLMTMLDFPEIQSLIDLQGTNGQQSTLLLYSLEYGSSPTVDRLIGLFRDQIKLNQKQHILGLAAKSGFAGVVEQLLDHGESIDAENILGETPLKGVVSNLCILLTLGLDDKAQTLLNVLHILLQRGANIFKLSERGWSALHIAAHFDCLELATVLVGSAKQLEDRGLTGSVQRLLRMIDKSGQSSKDLNKGALARYLRKELKDAVTYNGNTIMYDFGNSHVPEISEGYVNELILMRILHDWFNSRFTIGDEHVAKAFEQYQSWHRSRYRELDEEYELKKRQISSSGEQIAISKGQ